MVAFDAGPESAGSITINQQTNPFLKTLDTVSDHYKLGVTKNSYQTFLLTETYCDDFNIEAPH